MISMKKTTIKADTDARYESIFGDVSRIIDAARCAPQKAHPPSGCTWDEEVFMVEPVQDRPGDHFPTVSNSMSSVL